MDHQRRLIGYLLVRLISTARPLYRGMSVSFLRGRNQENLLMQVRLQLVAPVVQLGGLPVTIRELTKFMRIGQACIGLHDGRLAESAMRLAPNLRRTSVASVA